MVSPETRATLEQVVATFALGPVLEAAPLGGGSTVPFRVVTPAGTFVVKGGAFEPGIALYAEVEQALNAAGVRQARVARRPDGGLLAAGGWWVQEWISGEWTLQPAREQSAALMRYLGAYHRVLEGVAVPEWVGTEGDAWRLADSLAYVLDTLPGIAPGLPLLDETRAAFAAAVAFAGDRREELESLPVQLVDGDVGSENVLYTDGPGGPEAVMIDFTPYRSNHLQALVVSQYWHHLYCADGRLAIDRIADELRRYGTAHPIAAAERAGYGAIFARVALRHVAQELTHRLRGSASISEADARMRAACMFAVLDGQAALAAAARGA